MLQVLSLSTFPWWILFVDWIRAWLVDVLKFELQGHQHHVMITSYVSARECSCLGFADAQFKATGAEGDVCRFLGVFCGNMVLAGCWQTPRTTVPYCWFPLFHAVLLFLPNSHMHLHLLWGAECFWACFPQGYLSTLICSPLTWWASQSLPLWNIPRAWYYHYHAHSRDGIDQALPS